VCSSQHASASLCVSSNECVVASVTPNPLRSYYACQLDGINTATKKAPVEAGLTPCVRRSICSVLLASTYIFIVHGSPPPRDSLRGSKGIGEMAAQRGMMRLQ
jgi:hypothetical protein